MRKGVVLLILTLLATVGIAQNTRIVKGFVKSEDGKPVVGATIKAVDEDVTTTSTLGGAFEIRVSPYCKFVEARLESCLTAVAEIDGSTIIFTMKVDKKYAKSQEQARIAAEKEAAAKAKAEEEARIAAEKAAADKAEAERKAQEQARIAAEKEAAAKAKAEEEARIAAEKEAAAKAKAERRAQEQARIEAEKARIAAAKEAIAKAKAERRGQEFTRTDPEKTTAAKAEAGHRAQDQAHIETKKVRIAADKEAVVKAKAEDLVRFATEKAERKAQKLVHTATQKATAAKAKAEEEARIAAEKARIAAQKQAEAERIAKEKAEKVRLAKIEAEKRRKLYAEKQSGFASVADVSYIIGMGGGYSSIGIHYIAGYRINNLLYVGGGTGINFNLGAGPSVRGIAEPYSGTNILSPCLISVPVFAYFRANFLNRRCSPFFALAAGGNFSGKQTLHLYICDVKYNTTGIFFNPQLGVNFRTSTKTSLYLTTGFNGFTVPSCPTYTAFSATATPKFAYGVDIHLGLTF